MNTRYTSGPWAFDEPNGSTVLHPRIYSDEGTVGAAHWAGWNAGDRIAETRANAALMAAAPDMYEALKSLIQDCEIANARWVDQVGIGAIDVNVLSRARAALSKAEGKS